MTDAKPSFDPNNSEHVWDALSPEWENWIGDDGDQNRIECSDAIIWKWIENVVSSREESSVGISSVVGTISVPCEKKQLSVLDAGCGTGYLCVKLAQKGFIVFGVDISGNQLCFAKKRVEKFQLESKIQFSKCSLDNMTSIKDNSIDIVVSNYVLMDLQNYVGAVKEISRVLKPGGSAILVFSHPCFNSPSRQRLQDNSKALTWPAVGHEYNYFKDCSYTLSWGKFTHPFTYYHRPLSSYWKAFSESNLEVIDFEELGIGIDQIPCSLAFFLRKKM